MAHDPDAPRWTFLTNHAHVLLCLARSPALRLRDVAEEVGVTERAVQRIVADLEEGGYLTRHRSGRQNQYAINTAGPMRHPVESQATVRGLIALAGPPRLRTPARGAAGPVPRPATSRARAKR